MNQRSKIPTILGIVLLLAATFAGVFFINYKQIFKLGAEGESDPKDIRISNITDSSLTISFTTDGETSGFVILGDQTSPADEKSYTHSFTLTGLKPNTIHTYKINSGGTLYDNNGVPWQTTTSSSPISGTNLVSGSVLTATAQPAKKALVYATVEGNLFSTVTSDSGNFVFQLPGNDPTTTLIEIFVQAGPLGVSSAQIYLASAKPIPPIILGNTHDFRNLAPGDSGQVPSAQLDLPEDIDQESKFSIPEGSSTHKSTSTVTLESVDEGENVTSTQPEFFGKGPTNTTLTIEVHSESTITDNVSVSSSGSWNWSPPQGLSPGLHTITITWKDLSGITRSLTRNFIVQAGEAPAFEASQSGQTVTPSPTITPTSTPTSSPKATLTASPSIIASASISASASPLPETGSLTSVSLFTILGLGVLALSFGIWKLAENA